MQTFLPFLKVFLLLLLTQSSYAQLSSLSFQNIEGEQFQLYVNGSLINQTPDTYVSVTGLWNGIYWVRIVVEPQSKEPQIIEKKIPLIGINHLSFVVRKKNGKYKITLQSIGYAEAIFGTRIFRKPKEETPDAPTPQTKPNPDTPTEENLENNKPLPTDPYSMRISDSEFEEVKKNIQEELSDEQKVRIAKYSMKNTGYFSSEQVAELIDAISFEKEKLELAKFAYEYTYDRYQYYTKVSRSLKTNESKKELFDYLEGK